MNRANFRSMQSATVHPLTASMVRGMVFPEDDGPYEPPPPDVVLHQSLFDPQTQTGMVSAGDASANTLGTLFYSLVSGWATKVRFFKTALDTATTRSVGIYDKILAEIVASGTSVAEPAGPVWITVDLVAPVRIDPMRAYVTAVHFPNGHYPALANGLASEITRGYLVAPSDTDPISGAGNGRYQPGAAIAYPSSNFGAPNYWIDVVVDIPEWVDASTTGVPLGTVLTPSSGDMTITVNGTVVDALRVTGSITINADNVVIKNCEVIAAGAYHLIRVLDGIINTTIKDCKIIGSGQATSGILGNGSLWRNDISGVENGIAVTGPIDIRDNYMHGFIYNSPEQPHYDGIENNGGTAHKYIHNTIIVDQGQTSAVMLDNLFSGLSNIEVAYNYLSGAGYTLYCDGSFSDTNTVDAATIKIHHNRMGRGFYGYIALTPGVWPSPVPYGNYDAITGLPID